MSSTINNITLEQESILDKILSLLHYEKKRAKNIRPTDILQIYTSI